MVLLAAGVIAQPGDYPAPMDTECGFCHGPGNNELTWTPPFEAFIEPSAADDGRILLRPVLVNTWASELQEASIEIDISEAPALRFESSVPPTHQTIDGRIRVDATGVHVDPVTGRPTLSATQEQVEWMRVQVPAGATELRIHLAPTGSTPADLRLLVNGSIDPDRTQRINAQGPGGSEVLVLDAEGIQALGYGGWSVGAAMRLADGSGADPQVEPVPFQLRLDAWVNNTERSFFQGIDGALQPNEAQGFELPMILDADPTGQWLNLHVRLRMHYDHDDRNNPSDAVMMDSFRIPIGATDGVPTIGTQVNEVPVFVPRGVQVASVAEAIGYATTFLMVASMASGGVFGKASRRHLNRIFGTARRRVAFHNFLSYGLLAAAIAHLTLFLIETAYHWTVGVLWGGASIVCLIGLAVTGAVQVPLIRAWGHGKWRWTHFGFAMATLLFLALHLFLDGSNLGIAHDIGWNDPLVPDPPTS